ncbi:MAG: hypothetical protein JNK82_31300 [Myxococcaceae bacterium]|nr:hypothetical protein [Myxococcaceae bacterium]
MATKSEKQQASGLQKKVTSMRLAWMTVGLLAMLGFSACGVGVEGEDLEGQLAADRGSAKSEQQLTGREGCPTGDVVEGLSETYGAMPDSPGIKSLPSDPVPWRMPSTDDDGERRPGTAGGPPPPFRTPGTY